MMDSKQLEEFCQLGDRADGLLRKGHTREALRTYGDILAKLEHGGDIDSYLMAKVALGVLRCHVKLGDFKSAFTVWNAGIEDSPFGIGIYALESAQTTVQDMITYDMLCAFLHSLTSGDKMQAATAVDLYLSRVCEHAQDVGDLELMRLALSNWKQHLRDIFQASLPYEFAESLIRFERSVGEPVKLCSIDFPLPTSWEKPNDFREMSRVVRMKSEEITRTGRPPLRRHRAG